MLIANTSGTGGQARVTLHFEDGSTAERMVALLASSRTNVNVSTDFPTSVGKRFGVIVESLGATPGANRRRTGDVHESRRAAMGGGDERARDEAAVTIRRG